MELDGLHAWIYKPLWLVQVFLAKEIGYIAIITLCK